MISNDGKVMLMRAIVAIVVGLVAANVTRICLPNASVTAWTVAGIVVGASLSGFIALSKAWLWGFIVGAIDAAISAFLIWFVWTPAGNHQFPLDWDHLLGKLLLVEPVIGLIVAEIIHRGALYLGVRRHAV